MARPLSLTKPATPENLALFLSLVDVLGQRYGLHHQSVVDLRLLAEEACTNVVLHAYDEDDSGDLTLQIGYDDGVAKIVIEDHGRVFDPEGTMEPSLDAWLEDRAIGGLGWHLIRRLSDDLHYERVGGQNRLTLHKRVRAA